MICDVTRSRDSQSGLSHQNCGCFVCLFVCMFVVVIVPMTKVWTKLHFKQDDGATVW